MFDFNVYVVTAALAGILAFLYLGIIWKVLLAFIVMSQGFDLLPQIVYGVLVWDIGAIMLLVAAAQLMLVRQKEPAIRAVSITVMWAFIIWLAFCLVYSLLVYSYPVLNTLKTSRQMIIGYLSIFVFLRLFRADENALPTILKWLYPITYTLLLLAIVQQVIGTPILKGLVVEYRGAVRYIPMFLPIGLFFLWTIMSKYLQGERITIHEAVYGGLVLVVVATTYTRGIYIAVLASFLLMFFLLQLKGQLKATPVVIFIALISSGVAVLTLGGWADRVISRASSGLSVLLDERGASSKVDVDTFSGRLGLVKERIALVAKLNPIVGFGFLHEGDVPENVRRTFKRGSIIYSPEMKMKYAKGHPYVLALYSADIGWSNIVVNSGFVGSLLFLLFVGAFLFSYKKMKSQNSPLSHHRLAFFLQTVTLLLLMFNGNTFTTNVQIAAFMIAGYLFCSAMLGFQGRQPAKA